jgi:hypothetical protein
MTNDERLTAIRKLGYGERQAAFLCLAALHGGYFLRRQCNAFLGYLPGGSAEHLIEKAIRKGHVRAHESGNRTVIYHIGAKPFFEAIGEQDNRNRRWRQPYSIKIKLMGFDYVLAHREHQYLTTETEKLDYFSGNLGIDSSYLPGRIYRSKDGRIKTARYFVDKFPLFLSGTPGAAPPVVCFCYIDGEVRKPSGFDTYLLQYRDLFARLDSFRVVYVAADESMFPKAERIFSRLCGGSGRGGNGIPLDPEVRRLLDHFHDRDLLERRQTASFDKRQLDQLSDELREFRGPKYEVLYRHWQQQGEAAVCSAMGLGKGLSGTFVAYLVTNNYRFFGDLVRAVPG